MMNNNWAAWSIKHKQIIYFFVFLCLTMGIYSFNSLGRSEDPSFTIKQMVVTASWPGATAKEVEEHITNKLEKDIQNVPNVDYISSYSRPGVCVINVYLKATVPGKEIRQQPHVLRHHRGARRMHARAFARRVQETVNPKQGARAGLSPV